MPFKANDWSASDMQAQTAQAWRDQLDDVEIDVPPEGQALAGTLRTSTAHMLISRVGPSLRPGTRSYARSCNRDGAMIRSEEHTSKLQSLMHSTYAVC